MAAPTLERLDIPVAGMSCQACAVTIEKALRAVPGVVEASVNYGSRSANVVRDRAVATGEKLAQAVARAGYSVPGDLDAARTAASNAKFSEAAEKTSLARVRRDAILAVGFGALVLLAHPLHIDPQLALLLSIPVQFVAGAATLSAGARAALRRAPDMNSLVALGSLTAWSAAATEILRPGSLPGAGEHLHAAVLILAFVLVGRWLEARVRNRAGDAVKRLYELAPERVRVLRRGQETEVALEEVQPGNLVRVRPGERIPVDGEILDGSTWLDESTWTGESSPVARGPGELIRAGSLNGAGAISMRATGVGADSSLGRVAAAVRSAQGSRAPVQELADRISGVFVPVVLAIAALTLVVWFLSTSDWTRALSHTVAVLVVACPCALGLATPAAVIAAVGRGAREGVLVRDAGALQRLAALGLVVFDKTGTLTLGRPVLVATEVSGISKDEALALAASVEARSEQPIGRALHAAAANLAVPALSDFRSLPGAGVEGKVGERAVFVGSRAAAALRARNPEVVEQLLAPLIARGETTAVLVVDGIARAAFGFSDELRPSSRQAIAHLRRQNVEVMIFSGDNPSAVERVAADLEIERARGAMTPESKAEAIAELTNSGRSVAMVGDGVNDAAALARADVGIAMGGGADVAIEAADCTILRADPERVPILIALGRATLHTVHVNLTWAFGYNLLALPAAAGVLEPLIHWSPSPALSAAAMALSSIAVVLNSLRLRSVKLVPGIPPPSITFAV
ncbi:MAG TPA: cation-translocating P-type ATPase [Planctomycetota bacterium]|nr:cation-translocating P-type ATPase [Planctomycetota bacterium]